MAAVAARSYDGAPNGKTWHAQYPELGTGPVPIEPYISQEYFDLERERIFRKVWLNVGREEEIPKPGDYLVKDLPVCGASILLVRGKDGRIRAFHNVCSHRSNSWCGTAAARARCSPVSFTGGPTGWKGS